MIMKKINILKEKLIMRKDKMVPIRWPSDDWEKIIVPAAERMGMTPSNFVRSSAKSQAAEIISQGKKRRR